MRRRPHAAAVLFAVSVGSFRALGFLAIDRTVAVGVHRPEVVVAEGGDLAARLRDRGIIIRHFRQPARIAPYLRITIGTDEQTDLLTQALREILATVD